MSSDDWTDADFIPRVPDSAGPPENPDRAQSDRREWLRREIRSRLGTGETQPQVVAWLVDLGLEPGAATRLVAWASATTSVQNAGTGDRAIVFGVETHYESGLVVNDVVASASARAEARRRRAGQQESDAPAPDFEFAQPSDAVAGKVARSASALHLQMLVMALVALVILGAILTVML